MTKSELIWYLNNKGYNVHKRSSRLEVANAMREDNIKRKGKTKAVQIENAFLEDNKNLQAWFK